MSAIKTTLLAICFYLPLVICAQEKIEIERPIIAEKVPESARDFLQKYFPDSKTKWVLEITEGDNTYEAKLPQEKLSIEFFRNGDFLDAELTISKNNIPATILREIEEKLKSDFNRFKYQKIQKQFAGEGDDAIALLKQESVKQNDFAKINYEIIIWGKSKTQESFFEYLFDNEGEFVHRRKLSSLNSDNLFY